MEVVLEGSPRAHGSPGQPGELEKYRKGGEALAGPWRMHKSPLGGQSGEGHWRQREREKACHVWGTTRNSAQVGSWSVALGKRGRKGRRDRAGDTGGGPIMRVPQCQSRECGL